MASEMSGEQMQNRITAARRDAEGLKDKIKRKKDELADTTRKSSRSCLRFLRIAFLAPFRRYPSSRLWTDNIDL